MRTAVNRRNIASRRSVRGMGALSQAGQYPERTVNGRECTRIHRNKSTSVGLNGRAQFCNSHGSRVAPPRLRVGLPALKRVSLVARSVSEGAWAPWLAMDVLLRSCRRIAHG